VGEVIEILDGAHSVLGPSSSERWLNCGAGIGGPTSEYAANGVANHSLSEWVRETGKPAEHWKGKTLKVGEFTFPVGKVMIRTVNTFVESVQRLPGAALIEERVEYSELVPGGFGTLDDGRLHLDVGIITDLKAGTGVEVRAANNSQLKLYAIGVMLKYDWAYRFKKFVLRISQPRRGIAAETEYEEISAGHLMQWGYDVVRPRAELLLSGALKDELKAGPHCKFCGKKNTCEVRARYKINSEIGSFRRDASEELVQLED
jgi:hypothetical protein